MAKAFESQHAGGCHSLRGKNGRLYPARAGHIGPLRQSAPPPLEREIVRYLPPSVRRKPPPERDRSGSNLTRPDSDDLIALGLAHSGAVCEEIPSRLGETGARTGDPYLGSDRSGLPTPMDVRPPGR